MQRPTATASGNVLLDVFALDQRVGRLLESALSGCPLKPAEYALYSDIDRGPTTPKEIATRLHIPMSTLSGHLSSLASRGHIERVPNAADGRSYRVRLTPTGEETVAQCRPHFRKALDAVRGNLDRTAEIRRAIAELDQAIVAAIDQLAHSDADGDR